eukprot:366546-Chlamydomonas_euryale.AAC.8
MSSLHGDVLIFLFRRLDVEKRECSCMDTHNSSTRGRQGVCAPCFTKNSSIPDASGEIVTGCKASAHQDRVLLPCAETCPSLPRPPSMKRAQVV